MLQEFSKINNVNGELDLPGDKSISHRAVFFSSMAKGVSQISNLSDGADVNSTISCFRKLGVSIEVSGDVLTIHGAGFKGFTPGGGTLNAGNSGTTARLLAGLLSAQEFESEITGDESLSQRPMGRIIKPLSLMGAAFEGKGVKTLPVKIRPGNLKSINYTMPVASAQVKSSIIIAGIHSDTPSMIIERETTRDHTERMLGLKTERSDAGKIIQFSSRDYPLPNDYFIPSDISTASFFIVMALLTKNSELLIKNVSLNDTRTGILTVLKEMGANIIVINLKTSNNEPFGDLLVRSSNLSNVEIPEHIIPNIIDEIPILATAGVFAEGDFSIRFAKELRRKESDRISSVVHNFRLAGLSAEEYDDGFTISGNIRKSRPLFSSFNDHRIAMAFSIFSLLLEDGGKVDNFECTGISNPGFLNQLKQIIR